MSEEAPDPQHLVPATGRWPQGGLSAAGIRLRVWSTDDVPALLELQEDPDMRRWSPVFNTPDAADCVERVRKAVQAEEEGRPNSFAIVDDDDPRQVLGSIDWRNTHPMWPFSILDVGYGVSPGARGRGVASTALRLLAEWLLDPAGGDVHRVQLDHAVENEGSCRTAVRAGFAIEGRRDVFLPLRESPDAAVVRHDVCLHGRVRR
ncbi:GNAT family N-acetyltransferase [Angustibacter sp. McL0619]|uniref:GNAT family N-acetyltransferase n=1 Tax=Angustibacter sp. McL0619 TaxID=3415676 RepID=UPI003CF442BB